MPDETIVVDDLIRGRVEFPAEALDDFLLLPLTRHEHLPLLGRMLALRRNFSAYDACYLALAERLGASFVTGDGRLAAAARRHLELDVHFVDSA